MTIAFRAVGTVDLQDNNAAPISATTPGTPGGLVATDILLVVIGYSGGTGVTITPPSGWTLVNRSDAAAAYGAAAYWALGNVASFTFSIAGAIGALASIAAAYSGVDNATPMDATGVGQTNAAGATDTAPTITTVTANAQLVFLASSFDGLGGAVATWTAVFGTLRGSGGIRGVVDTDGVAVFDAVQAVAGASGSKTETMSRAVNSVGILAALRPAAAFDGIPPRFGPALTPGTPASAQTHFRSPGAFPQAPLDADDGGPWVPTTLGRLAAGAALGAATLLTSHLCWNIQQVDSEIVPQIGQVDEDYWQNPVAPVQSRLFQVLPLGDPEEIPAATLLGQLDEDFWVSGVAPVPATLGKLYLPDPTDIPLGSLFGQPDEDFWVTKPAPVVATLYQRLPYLTDPEELPAGSLLGQLDEDFWVTKPPPVVASLYQRLPYLTDPEEIPAGSLFGRYDEDFWVTKPVPVQSVFGKLYLPDPEELVVTVVATNPIDEDFWQNPVSPVLPTLGKLHLPDPEEIPAGSLFGIADELYWQNPVVPVQSIFARIYLPDPEELTIPLVANSVDEDFWINPVFPVQPTLGRLYLPDAEEIPAGSLFGQLDEDFWRLGPSPAVATLGRLYLPDPEELVVTTPATPVDEDYWQNQVVPIQSVIGKLYLPDADDVPLLSGLLEEDFWINPVRPVPAALYVKLPLGDPEELVVIQPTFVEEEYWLNPVSPRIATLWQKLPLGDPEEIPAGALRGAAEEYYWTNPVAPVPSTLFVRFPYLPDPEEIPPAGIIGPLRFTLTGRQHVLSLTGSQSGLILPGRSLNPTLTGTQSVLTWTGRQTVYTVTTVANKINVVDMPIGDDFVILLVFTNFDGTPFDLTGATVSFAMKSHSFDAPFLIQKDTGAFGGISINVPATAGKANLSLASADSLALPPGTYDFSAKATVSGKKNTQIIGTMTWIDTAGRVM